jgi:predicted PurR-regulated permease PerM
VRENVTYFDKEFGVTRVDLLEAISSTEKARYESMIENRRLLMESNEKLLARMDVEVYKLDSKIDKLDTKIDSKIDKLDTKIDSKINNLDTKINNLTNLAFKLMYGIVTAILVPILLYFLK